MPLPVAGRSSGPWAVAGLMLVLPLAMAAQAPPSVTLLPNYQSGSELDYSVTVHSNIGTSAQLETEAEVAMRILPGATPGRFTTEMRFTRYATKLTATDPQVQAQLEPNVVATDKAATAMTPVRFDVSPSGIAIAARATGTQYDGPVDMLEELARTDALPSGPVAVGSRWTHPRTSMIPTVEFTMPLALDCTVSAIAPYNGVPSAAISVHAQGTASPPPNAFPGFDQLAAKGLVPQATISIDTQTTSQYRLSDAILEESTSQTHNHMHVRYIGPTPEAQVVDTDITSSATITLEKIVPPAANR